MKVKLVEILLYLRLKKCVFLIFENKGFKQIPLVKTPSVQLLSHL